MRDERIGRKERDCLKEEKKRQRKAIEGKEKVEHVAEERK